MNILNPWSLDELLIPDHNSIIKVQVTKNNSMNFLNFNLKYNKIGNIELTTKNKNINKNCSGYDHIKIKIINNIGYIEQLSSTNKYSGTILMRLSLQILDKLNIEKCELKDNSTKKCKLENGNIKYLDYKLITLLRYGQTYYMKFGFKPMNGLNNVSLDLKRCVNILQECEWKNLDKYFIKLSELIKTNRMYEFLFKNSLKNWNDFKDKFKNKYNYPFIAFIEYNDSNCYLFNEWIVYLRYIFEKKNINNITNDKYFIEFNKMLDILLNVKWIKIIKESK